MTRVVPFLSIVALVSCAASASTKPQAVPSSQPSIERKIDSRTRSLIERLRNERIDETNAARLNVAKRFSNALIKVDDRGRIQLYIELSDLNPIHVAAVKRAGDAEIEISNASLKLVQAWVPDARIEAVAGLSVVTQIRPPDYSVRRIEQSNPSTLFGRHDL